MPGIIDFDDLFDRMCDAYANAAAVSGAEKAYLDIAGQRVAVCFAGIGTRDALLPALAHLAIPQGVGAPDLTITMWDSASSGIAPPRPDFTRTPIGPKGAIPALSRSGGRAAFAHGAGALQVYSVDRAHAIYWTDNATRLPYWERSLPFRQILAWFLAPTALLPAHAACVSVGGRAILLPGASGAGKSTTALRLALEGFDLIGDDYVLIEAKAPHQIWSLYRSAKIDTRSLTLLPELAPYATTLTATDEKAVVTWPTPAGGRLALEAEPAIVVLPRVSMARVTACVAPASPGDVVFALAPTTINHLDAPADKVMTAARGLAQSVPAHRLDLAPDHRGLSALVHDLLES